MDARWSPPGSRPGRSTQCSLRWLASWRGWRRGRRARRFAWSDPDALAPVARGAGLELAATEPAELAIRATSPESYIDAGREHPMAVAAQPALDRAGATQEVREAMAAVLRHANEDPTGFLVHSPYVIHELRRAE